jgi:hypothetical protein
VSEREKLTASHLRRQAFVYLRQSSQAQVERNVESTDRQYALVDRAVELGFTREQVERAGVIQPVAITDHGVRHAAQIQEPIPVGVVASQAGDLQAEHQPGKTEHSTQRRTAIPSLLQEDLAEWRSALQAIGHPARELDFIIPGDLAGLAHGERDPRTGACHFSKNQAGGWGQRFFTPAVEKAALQPELFAILGATPYSLRRGGISLRLRAEDPQTVASECGTSLRTLSNHYAYAIEGPPPQRTTPGRYRVACCTCRTSRTPSVRKAAQRTRRQRRYAPSRQDQQLARHAQVEETGGVDAPRPRRTRGTAGSDRFCTPTFSTRVLRLVGTA